MIGLRPEGSVMHRAPAVITPPGKELIKSLMMPDAFDHPVSKPELIETHISWLILAGDFAYKIKKPIVLDFLDFGDLAKRKHFCEEEIRLNRPWAPDIYLDVISITDDGGRPRFGGTGDAIEYAVRMRRFDQGLRLDLQLNAGELSVTDMKELALNIGARHEAAARIDKSQRSRVLRLTQEFMEDNFATLDGQLEDSVLAPLNAWTSDEFERCAALLASRFDGGYVRDCHGDLHLGNLVRLTSGITTFDCIEFNTDLRHIDTMCDITFLVMDLVARKRHDLAAHFLNRYLEATGDYEGVSVLSLFFVYRCLVRAKVAVIRSQERAKLDEKEADRKEALFYCDMATRQIAERTPFLVIMHGFSGSGKTWISGQLMAELPAIRIRSDVERKRLFGLQEEAPSHSNVGGGIYTRAANREVYARLFELARSVLVAGHNVILDAAFLEREYRQEALNLARSLDFPAAIVDVVAGKDEMHHRLLRRARGANDASEANLAVLDHQLSTAGALTPDERAVSVVCDNSASPDIEELVRNVKDAITDN